MLPENWFSLSNLKMNLNRSNLLKVGTVLAIAATAGIGFYQASKVPELPQEVWVPAYDPTPSAPVADVKVKSGTVRIKKGAEAKLKIPLAQNEGITSTSLVASNDHPVSVVSIVDTGTGITHTAVRQEPMPWLALDPHGEAGIYYGIKNGAPSAMLQAKQGIVQIKDVHLGAIGQVTRSPLSGTDAYVGIGVWYRW